MRLHNMPSVTGEDRWLGTLHAFPAVLHARASFSFDVNPTTLQKALFRALSFVRNSPLAREITVANLDGYTKGKAVFKIGVGNGEGFDILDSGEVERILALLERRGPFEVLDVAFHIHYSIADDRNHKIHEDHYIARLAFQAGRVEVLIHHLKGMRRIDSAELVGILLLNLNRELGRRGLPDAELDEISST